MSSRSFFSTLLLSALLLPAITSISAVASPQAFTVDKAHSRVGFIAYTKIFDADAHFKKWNATADFDTSDLSKSSIDVTVEISSVDSDSEKRDHHLLNEDFFFAKKYPTAHFKSEKFVVKSKDKVAVTGVLTVHGQSKTITLPLKVVHAKDAKGQPTLTFKGKTTINRHDFKMDYKSGLLMPSIKGDVTLNVALHFIATAPSNAP